MVSKNNTLVNLKGSSLNFSAHGWWGKEKNSVAKNPARNSPKEISGANGKFLPKPLLFHLRHPNSKTNQPKFWQILSPKNSFAKTSSALFRHLPEYLEGRTPKRKMSFPFSEKIGRAQIRKARNIFVWCLPRLCEAVAGLIHSFNFRSKKVRAKCIITAFVRNELYNKVRLEGRSSAVSGTRRGREKLRSNLFVTKSSPRHQ